MSPSCPISHEQVDANRFRVTATLVAFLVSFVLLSKSIVLAFILLVDFVLRYRGYRKYAPLFRLTSWILPFFKLEERMSDFAPKRFALLLGVTTSALMFVTLLLGFKGIFFVLGAILFVCALLEALFEYCIGCKLYHLYNLVKAR